MRPGTRLLGLALALVVVVVCPPAGNAQHAEAAAVRVDGASGPLSASLTLSTDRSEMGQEVRFALDAGLATDAGADAGARDWVEWPDIEREITDALGDDVVEVSGVRAAPGGRRLEAGLRFYDAGRFELPALRVRAWPATGRGEDPLAEVELTGAAIHVAGVAPDGAGPVPARDAVEWKSAGGLTGFVWAALVLLLAAGAALLLLVRRRRRPPPPPPPPAPPHERALAALRSLVDRRLPEQGRVEPYFVELSEILRRYLEERFGLRAPEQTTEEFLADVSRTVAGRRAIDAAHRDVLREFLTRADLVKFARDEPDVSTCREAAERTQQFVEDTVPRTPAEDAR